MSNIKEVLIGKPRDIHDPKLFHKISLIAFLAWVGLGADGLSSSAYGPDEAFRALSGHTELAVLLAVATALTVFIISYAYSRIIEHFPSGGGGFVVATKLLGAPFGVVSGSALLVDYILTITVSIASGAAQIFSFLPYSWQPWMVPVEAITIILLVILNLRGIKESIEVMVPIFITFVVAHLVLFGGAIFQHLHEAPVIASQVGQNLHLSYSTLGFWGMFVILARAYSRGAGTYTGIEAVSNGIQIMREPRVPTAKRTMMYMATSLAITAGAILLIYLLLGVTEQPGKTLNAVMVEKLNFGEWYVVIVLLSEAALLFVAAQTGFIDGPRVMANMANDRWLPHRFASLSDRLTMHYGIIIIGASSIATLLYTGGNIDALVTMYSINVFITFSLTEIGMVKFWITGRKKYPEWKKSLPVHMTGLVLCLSILTIVVIEKFQQGAWMTVVVTSLLILLCVIIRRHYRLVAAKLRSLSDILVGLPTKNSPIDRGQKISPNIPTAILLVESYNGLGIHSLLNIIKQFPGYFKQIVFVSVGVVDSGNFKGIDEVERLEANTKQELQQYEQLATNLGLVATSRMSVGTEAVEESEKICKELSREFKQSVFFAGKLVFQKQKWYQRILHSETAFAIQNRLELDGLSMVVLPVRVWN
ncbi:MAG: APC family permease [Bacteroidota bacterium]